MKKEKIKEILNRLQGIDQAPEVMKFWQNVETYSTFETFTAGIRLDPGGFSIFLGPQMSYAIAKIDGKCCRNWIGISGSDTVFRPFADQEHAEQIFDDVVSKLLDIAA